MSGKIDIHTLSMLLGHKDLKMTERCNRLAPVTMTKAAHVMDEVYSAPTETKVKSDTVACIRSI